MIFGNQGLHQKFNVNMPGNKTDLHQIELTQQEGDVLNKEHQKMMQF